MKNRNDMAGNLLDAFGIVAVLPYIPPRDPSVTTQEEFLPGTEARLIQDQMDARGWHYRFVCRVTDRLIMIERQYDDFGLTLCVWADSAEKEA